MKTKIVLKIIGAVATIIVAFVSSKANVTIIGGGNNVVITDATTLAQEYKKLQSDYEQLQSQNNYLLEENPKLSSELDKLNEEIEELEQQHNDANSHDDHLDNLLGIDNPLPDEIIEGITSINCK